ncbi:MAG: hypothetical protein Q7S61_03260 [bacterium]|nr:hypothetical protein [bacterium]
MADQKNNGAKFGLGVLVGTVLGGLAAFFLSPGSGEENREMVKKKVDELVKLLKEQEIDKKVKEIYGEVTAEGKKAYTQARKELVGKIEDMKDEMENFDKEKYMEMVEDVVKNVEKTAKNPEGAVKKLRESLIESWNDMMTMIEKQAKSAKMSKSKK